MNGNRSGHRQMPLRGLLQAQQALYKVHICGMHFAVLTQPALALGRLFRENVTLERLLMGDFSGCRNLEALFSAGIRFNLRHGTLVLNYPLRRFRTGGTLVGPLQELAEPPGIPDFQRSAKLQIIADSTLFFRKIFFLGTRLVS